MNILVSNLNPATNSETLLELFLEFGTVSIAKVITDNETGQSKGLGFVEMPDDDEAHFAIAQLTDRVVDGNTISVKKTRHNSSIGEKRRGGFGSNQ